MSEESYLDKMINTRFIIPLKIITGAMVLVLVFPLIRPGVSLADAYILISDSILYSLTACMMYTVGEYVFHIGNKVYLRLKPKEAETT